VPRVDPDFARLYARRNDAESINRALDDSLYLGRAHPKGQLRQHAEILGYGLMVNSLTSTGTADGETNFASPEVLGVPTHPQNPATPPHGPSRLGL
jgi:hypothetical protein